MSHRILVTAVGGDIGRDIVRSLRGYDEPVHLVGCDMDHFAVSIPLLDAFVVAPPAAQDEARYLEFLRQTCREHSCDTICPSSELEIEILDRHRAEFPTIHLMLLDSSILRVALDKAETAHWLEQADLPFAKTVALEQFSNQWPWPVILKRRHGNGSKGVFLVRDAQELSVYGRQIQGAIVQENMGTPEEEYTVGVFSDGQDIRQIQFHRRLGFGGLSRIARRIEDSVLTDLIHSMAQKLALRGSMNVQLRKVGDHYVPFEINPRLSSTVYLRHCMGFQDACWWLALFKGKKMTYTPRPGKLMAIRLVDELFFDVDQGQPVDLSTVQKSNS
jgi:carbamoyl-phosphate synthase large subunit